MSTIISLSKPKKKREQESILLKLPTSIRIITTIIIALIVLTIILPIILLVLYSILPSGMIPNLVTTPQLITNATLEGYAQVFQQMPFLLIAWNSIFLSFTQTFLQLLIAFITAYALTHWNYPAKKIIFSFIIMVMIIPTVALMIPNYMSISNMGLVKTYTGVLLPGIASAYGMFLMMRFFEQVPISLVESAALDGANNRQILWHVYLPLTLPAISALMIILVVGNWNEYQWPLLVLQDEMSLTLPLALVRFRNEGVIEWMPTAAACIMTIIPMLALYIFLQKRIVETYASSATKG